MRKTYNLLLAFCASFFTMSTVFANLGDQLILHYPLDGNATDMSVSGVDGIVHGATPTVDRNGKVNGAYEFDGVDDYIQIPSNAALEQQFPITVSLWMYMEDSSEIGNRMFLADTSYAGYYLVMSGSEPGKVTLHFGNNNPGGGGGPIYARRTLSSSYKLNSKRWYHIAGVIRGANDMELYINGTRDAAATYSGNANSMVFSPQDGAVGKSTGTLFFRGKLDDIRVWNRSLAASEVTELYLNQDLILHYNFNGNANDNSGLGNHGVINGASMTTDAYGNANSAYEFDGVDDYIQIPMNPTLQQELPITMAMWVYLDDSSDINNRMLLIDTAYAGYYMTMSGLNPAQVAISFGNNNPSGGGGPLQARRTLTSSVLLNSQKWHYVVGVIRGFNDMELYIDGVRDMSATYSGGATSMVYSNVHDGAVGAHNNTYFKGKLDDIRVWKRALDSTEITKLNLHQDLILHYAFNGNTQDGSGYNHHGTLNGALLNVDATNASDKAYEFDGVDDYIEVPSSSTLQAQFPLTIAMWVYLDDSSDAGNRMFLNDTAYAGYSMTMSGLNLGQVALSYGNNNPGGGGGPLQARRTLTSSTRLNSQKWHYIVGIIRGFNDMELYIDGVRDLSATYDGGASAMVFTNKGGAVGHSSNFYFKGKLDDICVWKRDLSSLEVTQLYSSVPVYTNTTTTFISPAPSLIKIYPNPASESLSIQTQMPTQQMVLYNQLGAVVRQIANPASTTQLQVDDLPAGVYYLHTQLLNRQTVVNKVLIQ